ncbi:hypothetical protein CVV65_05805 [Kyrpidia spormannii]|uniref:DUF1643 domain-containing protein n=1 Tax=Kyrpidia spormannii TaxID=2055160 RepID=A0A2K8N5A1_9BACL|nr:hypothetical protein [Kyrpidia spormannii]ATY84529.1 hypothetical protein CVV65_05805 [Kyrpidia spormannii]
MDKPRAYGVFIKNGTHTCRTAAYIQWATSKVSIGSCLLLNPGSADLIDSHNKDKLNFNGEVRGEIRLDHTMNQLIRFVEQIFKPSEPDGRFYIYNLFSIQQTSSSSAFEEFKSLVETGYYDPTSSLVDKQELKKHPWILLGWGCDEESFPVELRAVKDRWLELISHANIPCFGKKHPEGKGYYHPSYALYHPELIDELVSIYKLCVSDS